MKNHYHFSLAFLTIAFLPSCTEKGEIEMSYEEKVEEKWVTEDSKRLFSGNSPDRDQKPPAQSTEKSDSLTDGLRFVAKEENYVGDQPFAGFSTMDPGFTAGSNGGLPKAKVETIEGDRVLQITYYNWGPAFSFRYWGEVQRLASIYEYQSQTKDFKAGATTQFSLPQDYRGLRIRIRPEGGEEWIAALDKEDDRFDLVMEPIHGSDRILIELTVLDQPGFLEWVLENLGALVVSIVSGLLILAFAQLLSRRQKVKAKTNPVEISVERFVGDEWQIALPGKLPDASTIEGKHQSGSTVHRWLLERGGIDVGATILRISVRGLAHETVEIRSIRAEVEKNSPLMETCVTHPTAGADEMTVLGLDLDELDCVAREIEVNAAGEIITGARYFDSNTVTLKKGEIHTFKVYAHTSKYFVRWSIEMDIQVGDNMVKKTLLINGNRFETTAESEFKNYFEWAWHDGHRFIPQILE